MNAFGNSLHCREGNCHGSEGRVQLVSLGYRKEISKAECPLNKHSETSALGNRGAAVGSAGSTHTRAVLKEAVAVYSLS